MSRVITAADVRARLSLTDDEGINAAIESSLDGALVKVSSLLLTSLGKGAASDLFYVDADYAIAYQGLHTLRLSNGFVRGPVSCYAGSSLEGALASTSKVPGVILLAEKGHLRVSEGYAGHYIRVEYEYGFEAADTAPEWLREVLITLTTLVMASQQISDGKSELAELIPAMERHWSGIMDTKLRYAATAIPPLN